MPFITITPAGSDSAISHRHFEFNHPVTFSPQSFIVVKDGGSPPVRYRILSVEHTVELSTDTGFNRYSVSLIVAPE